LLRCDFLKGHTVPCISRLALTCLVAQHDFATEQPVLDVEEKILTCLCMAPPFADIPDLLMRKTSAWMWSSLML
jgi:hypothetical protein